MYIVIATTCIVYSKGYHLPKKWAKNTNSCSLEMYTFKNVKP